MRRLQIIILISLFIPLSGISQTRFGIQAGPQISYRTGYPSDLDQKTKALFSFQAGAFSQHKFSKNFSLRPVLAFSNKGIVFKDIYITDALGNDIGVANLHSRISYLELLVPLLFQLNAPSSVNFYAGAGPWFAYALSGKDIPKNYKGMGTVKSSEIDMDNINRFDIGATIQFIVEFAKRWQSGLQYNPAFTDITDGGAWQNKNNSFILSIGFILH